ncbi:hypothetical protein ACF059_13080 [Streptomyces sp. NPDC016562]
MPSYTFHAGSPHIHRASPGRRVAPRAALGLQPVEQSQTKESA